MNENKAGTPKIVSAPTEIRLIGIITLSGFAIKLYPYNKKE